MKNKSEIFSSPAEGNAFGLAMQKAGGDYKAAKAMLDASPANYGSGSPFKLMKDKNNGRPKVKTLGEKEFISENRMGGFAEDTTKTNIQKDAAQRTTKSIQRQALKDSAKKSLKELKKR